MAKKAKSYTYLFYSVLVSVLVFSYFVLNRSFVLPCANTLSCEQSFEFSIDNDELATFNGVNITPPRIDLPFKTQNTKVLGDSDTVGNKHIYVDLSTQTMKAYEGDELYFETKVSTGKWFPTPTGDFKIWRMVRATKMSGGEGASYYYLPNVPFVMFFGNSEIAPGRGFALHGAYWHNNFGHAMSHGCVNMRTIDAQKIYEWIDSGENPMESVTITIYGETT